MSEKGLSPDLDLTQGVTPEQSKDDKGKGRGRRVGAVVTVFAVGAGGVFVGAELPNNGQMSTIQIQNEEVRGKLGQQGVDPISGLVLHKGFGPAPDTMTFKTDVKGSDQEVACEGPYSVDSKKLVATVGPIVCSFPIIEGPEGQ